MKHSLLPVFLFLCSCSLVAQRKTDEFLVDLLRSSPSPVVAKVLQSPDSFRCQVIYTRIDRNAAGKPSFHNFFFNVDKDLYFNPASMVKLPLAALSLEKLGTFRRSGVDIETTMFFDSSFAGQIPLYTDSTSETGKPSLGQFIRKAFLISDNDAYNRMYQFVGQQQVNRRLQELGYRSSRITRQFMGFSEEGNRHTNPVRFVDNDGTILAIQPPAYNRDSFHYPTPVLIGQGYMNRDDSLVHKPFDFTRHNDLPLEALHMMLRSMVFPESVSKKHRFKITEADREFILQYLSQFPSETDYPRYDDSVFYDSYVKFFFRDSTHRMPEGVRVFNKVGWAYGFLTDVSYVLDTLHQVEYMLAATIYVNSDGILNDNKYEYDEIGYPFLRAIGQSVYQYELRRQRPGKAYKIVGLSRYATRTPSNRPAIRVADN